MDKENNKEEYFEKYIPNNKQGWLKSTLETIGYMIVIILIVVFIRYVFISPFAVEGSSMEPTLHNKELIIVNKIGYANWFSITFGEPQRGDFVVIRPPNDPKKYYIKRIIGLPGETLYFHNGDILVENDENPSGIKISEAYLSTNSISTAPPNGLRNTKITIPERNYYVLGDNRGASSDSRSFGPVHRQNIVGKTEIVIFPLPDIRSIEDTDYGL